MNILLDFLLLGAIGAACVATFVLLATRMPHSLAYRTAVGFALAAAFLLFWVNGAVGVVGDEGNPANLMYGCVLAVGLAGSVIARLRPRGMAFAMFAAALGTVLVPAIALAAGMEPREPGDLVTLTLFFAALWGGSGVLFRRAGEAEEARRNRRDGG